MHRLNQFLYTGTIHIHLIFVIKMSCVIGYGKIAISAVIISATLSIFVYNYFNSPFTHKRRSAPLYGLCGSGRTLRLCVSCIVNKASLSWCQFTWCDEEHTYDSAWQWIWLDLWIL